LIRTAVGDAHVISALHKHQLLLGGEQSGHIIMADYMPTADGIMTALRILETVISTDNWSMDTFVHFPQSSINLPVAHKKDLNNPALDAIIKFHQSLLTQGRIVVRYSGTEPLLRIMVEEQQSSHAHVICMQLANALQQELS
jgi:phosphoglucosamine mutase